MMIDPEAKLLAVLDKAEEYRGLAIRAKDRRERECYVRIVELYVEIAEELEASGCRRTGNRRTLRRANETPAGLEAPFDDPIPRPHGRRLVTLEDAGNFITKLPKAEHEDAEWQAAMEALILVATLGGPTMFA